MNRKEPNSLLLYPQIKIKSRYAGFITLTQFIFRYTQGLLEGKFILNNQKLIDIIKKQIC